ncbi:hypothetical protein HOA56_05300 [archaeon]|jgi:hypothetical protein|nr:hypothetical protein [archaeon]
MYILGINIPLAEFLFVIVLLLLTALVVIIFHLRKLEEMTTEERAELKELEKITLEEKEAIEKISGFEAAERQDLTKFENDIKELEMDTETIYLKKMVPDVYKLQNYVLWALKKGMSTTEIKEKLLSKGWKDKKLIDMVIEDMSKYVKYYHIRGSVDVPAVTVQKTTNIINPTRIIEVKTESKKRKKPTKKKKSTKKKTTTKKKKSIKKKDSELDKVEAELKKLEKEISVSPKKPKKIVKKSSPKKKTVSTKKTTSAKKSTVVKKSAPAKKKKTARRSRSKDLLIGTKGGNKYHSATCIVMKKVKKGNVVTFKNSNEALKKGYKPCTVCSIESRD